MADCCQESAQLVIHGRLLLRVRATVCLNDNIHHFRPFCNTFIKNFMTKTGPLPGPANITHIHKVRAHEPLRNPPL